MTLVERTQKTRPADSDQEQMAEFAQELGFQATEGNKAPPENGVFTGSFLDKSLLEPAPIDPDWILEGTPEAKCKNLSSIGKNWTAVDHWSCTAGRFRWHYHFDETILILEGKAVIVDEKGIEYLALPGTTLSFPEGTKANWTVPEYVRKIAFNQKSVPTYLQFFCRAVIKIQRKLFT